MNIEAPVPDGRIDAILDRIRGSFAEKGFDGASMQDLARAAGMSVGNFYRYFSSKAAIVEAMVTRDLADVERDFSEVMAAPDPMASLMEGLRERIAGEGLCDANDAPLWAEITAASMRKPEIGQIVGRMETAVERHLLAVFAHVTGLPPDEAGRRFRAHAVLIVMLVKASAMQTQQKADADLHDLILRTVEGVLAEVLAAKG